MIIEVPREELLRRKAELRTELRWVRQARSEDDVQDELDAVMFLLGEWEAADD